MASVQDHVKTFLDRVYIPKASLQQIGDPNKLVLSAMEAVLLEYSRADPQVASEEGLWAGAEIELEDWFSSSMVLTVEHPTGQRPKCWVDDSDIEIDPDTGAVYLLNGSSGSGYKVRYTALHTLGSAVTIDTAHIEAFYQLTLSHLCADLATYHAETRKPDMAADAVNYQSKRAEYAAMSKRARTRFRKLLGLPEQETPEPGFAESDVINEDRNLPDAWTPTSYK